MKSNENKETIKDFQCNGKEKSIIELVKFPKEKTIDFFPEVNQIIFVSSGILTISHKEIVDRQITEGESVLISMKNPYVIKAQKNAKVFFMRLDEDVNFHNYLPTDLMPGVKKKKRVRKGDVTGFLKPHLSLTEFFNMLENYVSSGIKNARFFELKIQEFFLLIQEYYDQQQIINFFTTIYTSDFIFSNNVFRTFDKAKTSGELAVMLGYSLSGFEKKFKRIFGISPYQWMQEQRAKKIYQEISFSSKTFTQIAKEYGFSSPAHLNDFCKLFLGYTPGKLRKQIKAEKENVS